MLILILIDVQYSQKTVFHFKKGSNGQNHSFSGPHHPVTPPCNFQTPPPPQWGWIFPTWKNSTPLGGNWKFLLFGKPCHAKNENEPSIPSGNKTHKKNSD